jgi:hypothetical protein
MALTLGILETRACASETRESNCIARLAKSFLYLRLTAIESRGRVATPKPTLVGRRGPEPWDSRQRRSPPWLGGEARSYRTGGSAEAHSDREARSGTAGHVAALEPASAGR